MKMVPVRAVTLTRKREVEEAERDGEKLKQGLYALHQTDWIIPPPIQNGVIPKNAFGNMDCYVPTMVPRGAVHIPLRSTVRICKRLGIDFAEAVTGFEFGKQRAVPVITGVVVAEEHEHAVIDEYVYIFPGSSPQIHAHFWDLRYLLRMEGNLQFHKLSQKSGLYSREGVKLTQSKNCRWEKDEEERRIKEDGKREKAALATWRKWLMGLRIIERVREEYGGDTDAHIAEEMNPFTNPSKVKKALQADVETGSTPNGGSLSYVDDKEGIGGGFFADDDDDLNGGGFFSEGHDEVEVPRGEGELTIEDERVLGDSGALNGSTPMKSDVLHHGPLNTDGSQGSPIEADLDEEVIVLEKASTNRKRAAASTSGSKHDVPSKSTKRRAAPKRKAGKKSESALKSHFFEHESDEDDQSNQENLTSKEVAVKKPAKRQSTARKTNIEDGSGPSTRASTRKSTRMQ